MKSCGVQMLACRLGRSISQRQRRKIGLPSALTARARCRIRLSYRPDWITRVSVPAQDSSSIRPLSTAHLSVASGNSSSHGW